MADRYSKVYISMPHDFLFQLDQLAREEHQSRSAIIREAVKLYMEWKSTPPAARFFALSDELRSRLEGITDQDLADRIDQAVTRVRDRGE